MDTRRYLDLPEHRHWRGDDRWGGPPAFDSAGGRILRLWVPVILTFFVQVPAVAFRYRAGDEVTPAVLALELAVAAIGPLALIGARRFPGPVVAVVTAGASLDLLLSSRELGPPYLSLAFAIVLAVVRGARVWAWISVAAGWVLTLVAAGALGIDWQPVRIVGITFGILLLFGIAESVRTRKDRFEQVRSRAEERKLTEVQAERVRIARELHDVLAHSLSQINVQAGVGLHLMDRQPEKAAEALASIKETSRTALDEVRSVLGVLRADGGAEVDAPLVPEPDLSRLPGLAASVTAQGIEVTLVDELASTPPASMQLAIYRIVQESLTNAVRHSGAHAASVTIGEDDRVYTVTVTDDGRGRVEGAATEGRGLLGMRERAELLGGHLETLSGGGFTVTAVIPKPEALRGLS